MTFEPGARAEYQRRFTQDDFDRFARLIRDDNPIHVDPAFARRTWFGGTLCHGMLLYGAINRALTARLPGPGALPLELELMFPSGTFAGDRVTVRVCVREVEASGVLGLEAVVEKPVGDSAVTTCQGRVRVLPDAVALRPAQAPPLAPAIGGDARQLHGIALGQRAADHRVFRTADVVEYAALTGDVNPVHLDDQAAHARGLDRCAVPGPLVAGMFSDLLGTRLPGRGTGWMKQRLWFSSPALVGEQLRAEVEVIRLRAAKEIVNLRTTCWGGGERLICTGVATVWVHNLERSQHAAGHPRATARFLDSAL